MNILILSWRGPKHPQAGGAEQATHEHAKAWVKAGHKVSLFTSYFPGAPRHEKIAGINIIRSGEQAFGVKIAAFIWYQKNKSKIDLVVDQFHGLPFFTPLYTHKRKIAYIHEVTKEVWKLNPWPKPFNLIPALIGGLFEPLIFLFYRSTPFMTVSPSTKTDLIKWGIPERNIKVIYNGVNAIDPQNITKEKDLTLVYLGALTSDKGVDKLPKIFLELNKIDNNWQFWVVGKGEKDYVEGLKNKFNKFGLLPQIKFWGFVDKQKKFELLKKAHLMINPSVREGWGLVNIEAASVGTPTIGFNVAGMKDSISNGKTGILVEKGDLSAMASSVVELLNDKKKYKKIQKQAIKWSKKFSWGDAGSQSLKLIMKLVNRF